MSRFVLGVEPVTPAYKTFLVAPRFRMDGVTWAEGRVPTPTGEPIVVRWEMFDEGWKLWCRTPGGLKGTVKLPKEVQRKGKSLNVNGLARDLDVGDIEVGGADGAEIDIEILF